MSFRCLTNFRLVILGLIAGTYFLTTVRILTVSKEDCPDVSKLPGMPDCKRQAKEPQGVGQLPDDNDLFLDEGQNKNVDENNFQLGPMGKEVVVGERGEPLAAPAAAATAAPHQPHKSASTPVTYSPDSAPAYDLLDPNLTPSVVYVVWCGRRWFEFHHYLSLLSAIRHLRPDNIRFLYDTLPIQDYWIYNTWFEELRDSYPFIHVEQLPADSRGCISHSMANMTYVMALLQSKGGIYLNEHTILTEYPVSMRRYDLVHAIETGTNYGFLAAKRGILGSLHPLATALQNNKNSMSISCASVSSYNLAPRSPNCVIVSDVFYPHEIWQGNSSFARLVRSLFYGHPEPVDAVPSYDELIPNIAHIVWLGGGRMDYLFYLGVLSLLYVAEVNSLYIHGDAPPSGPLWQRLQDHPRIKLIYRETPKTVYGQRVEVLSHVTDVWRVDFMIRYGGIYVDTDTVFVKKLDKEIRGYSAVGSYDWTYWNPPFPDTINFGVAIGKRNAEYWHEFQKSMKWFIDNDWSWNGLRQPYRIKERKPHLVKIDPHLQVICYEYKCHPTWWPDYHNESIHHLNSPSIKDWRKDAYAFHWTLPTPPELDNEELLLTSTTMAAEVGRYVLQKAGLLDELRKKYIKDKPLPPGAKGKNMGPMPIVDVNAPNQERQRPIQQQSNQQQQQQINNGR